MTTKPKTELGVADLVRETRLPRYTINRLIHRGIIQGMHRHPRGHYRLAARLLPGVMRSLAAAGYAAES